jgi:hypothetical protein
MTTAIGPHPSGEAADVECSFEVRAVKTRPVQVEVGQRYVAWGKTWEVTKVWEKERVAAIVNVADPTNHGRHPLSQFKEMVSVDHSVSGFVWDEQGRRRDL